MPRGKAAGKDRHGPSRRVEQEEDNSSAWLTTYGDAVTLLLAFFVMLFAMSTTDAARFEEMAKSMRAAFNASEGLLPENVGLVGDAQHPGEPQPDRPDLVPPAPAVGPDLGRTLADELNEVLAAEGLLDIAEVVVTPDAVVVRVRTDDVLFATGSAEVRPVARQVVAAVAPSLKSLPNDIRIEGHTDDVPLRQRGYTNWNLSADRAVAVLSLLADDHGIAPPRLSAVGFGEFAPLVANADAASRSVNRRVEIVIVTDPDAAGSLPVSAPETTPEPGATPAVQEPAA